jgi:DNA-binding CsgD family transcriptional regulator
MWMSTAAGPSKSGNVTTLITVKMVAFAEAQTIRLVRSKRGRKERPQMGFAGLSPRQLAFLHHVGQNKSRDEIAQIMGVAPSTVAAFTAQVKKRVGLQDLQEIARSRRATSRPA